MLWHTFRNWIQFTPKSPPSQVVLCTWPSGNHESERISHFLLGRPHWFGEFSLWSRSVFTCGITSGNIIGCEMSVNKSGQRPPSWNCRNVCGILSETVGDHEKMSNQEPMKSTNERKAEVDFFILSKELFVSKCQKWHWTPTERFYSLLSPHKHTLTTHSSCAVLWMDWLFKIMV